jgi:CRISPR-associated endonuclease/helicase Cas3
MKKSLARPGQLLTTHLINVGNGVGKYLSAINGPVELGKLIGYLHDFGKFNPAWQQYLNGASLRDRQNILPHAIHGALQAWSDWQEDDRTIAIAISLVIAGHHSGLMNVHGYGGLLAKLNANRTKLSEIPPLPADFDSILDETIDDLSQNLATAHDWLTRGNPLAMSLKIRYLFSVLVASDRNDAANCSRPISENLSDYPIVTETLDILFQKLSASMSSLLLSSDIDRLRFDFWEECVNGNYQEGWIGVDAPTGVWKTRSLIGLALTHAIKQQKSRIIYCAPFNTTLDQALDDCRDIFGSSAIGYFSTFDPEDPEIHEQFTEEWRHPIVLASMVQLFESLFSHETTPCRKLANIANSVIVLDGAEFIPTGYLSPILAVLQSLTDGLGCSVVISSNGALNYDRWQIPLKPAIRSVDRYRKGLLRATFHQRGRMNWTEISQEISTSDRTQVLVVVQTISAARDAYRELSILLPDLSVVLITGKMPPIHRQEVFGMVKNKLEVKLPILLITTAGIQFTNTMSFPAGYFEQIGIDRLLQSTEYINTNGEYGDYCDINIFKTVTAYKIPRGDLAWRKQITDTILYLEYDLASSNTIEEFNRRLLDKVDTDEHGINAMLSADKLSFRDVSDAFNLILPTIPVFIRLVDCEYMFDRALLGRNWAVLDLFKVNLYESQVKRCSRSLELIDIRNPELGYIWIGQYDFGLLSRD